MAGYRYRSAQRDKREQANSTFTSASESWGAAMTAIRYHVSRALAAREVGKALGLRNHQPGKSSAAWPRTWEWKDPKETTERQFRDAGFDLNHPRVSKFCELYQMAQVCRATSPAFRRHGDLPGSDSIPWCLWSPPDAGRVVVQWG